MKSFWLDVVTGKANIMVIDCGYARDRQSWERYDRLKEQLQLGRRCFAQQGHGRMVAQVPPAKQERALALGIVPVVTYFGTTHSFPDARENEER